MWLKICQVGEPVLRQRARELTPEEIPSPAIAQLIAFMRDTMRDAPGVGLAAPQVGLPLRLAVVEDRSEYQRSVSPEILAEREREPVPLQVLINPVLTREDPTPARFFEGCLSLDGYCALVERARRVHVTALDERGTPVSFSARGWHARILQHEIDHLDGTLYIDRMAPRSFMRVENYGRYWAHRPMDEINQLLGLGSTS